MKTGDFLRIIIMMQGFSSILGGIKSSYFRIINQTEVAGPPLHTVVEKVESNMECARKCHNYTGCAVSHYNSHAESCDLYDWKVITLVTGSNDDAVIMKSTVPMFHVHSPVIGVDMTLEEAVDLCISFESQLAPVDNLYDASDASYHRCACGWFADGSIRFAIQTLENSCYGYRIGVNSCKTIMTQASDAYCTVRS